MKMSKIIKGRVIKGLGNGKSQAFATINLDSDLWPQEMPRGIYAAWVFVDDQKYKGALFFGQREIINETTDVLEIHLLDFDGDLYGKEVGFSIENFIREVRPFSSFSDLKNQISADIAAVRQHLND